MKKLVVVLAVALVGVGAGAAYLWQQLAAERSLNAELNDRVMALEVTQQAAALAPAPAPIAATELAAAAAQAAAPPAAAGKDQADANNPTAGIAAVAKEMLSTKAGQDMTRTMMRSMITQQYPDLGKELGLTPEQATQLLDTLTRQMVDASSESMNLLAGNGGPDAMRELQRKSEEIQRTNDAEIASLLGSKYPQFQEYQGTMAARQQVSQLQNTLSTSGIAGLTDSQKQGLITALGAEQQRINQEARNAPPAARGANTNFLDQQVQQATDQSRRLVNAASAYLNPQQLESYKKMQDQQLEMVRGLMGAFGGTQGGAGPTQ
jgi:hypothetical protein